MDRIFWAGDSTVAFNGIGSYPQTGIGQAYELFVKEGVQICNYAKNGRSTKSFIEEGLLQRIEENIGEEDFLYIQFGHNDEKPDLERATDPFTTYQENLMKMIRAAQRAKAHPLLITPLYRRKFDEQGRVTPGNHLDYPDAMLALAGRTGVPVVDLCEISRRLLERTGDEASKRWFMWLPQGVYENYPDGLKDDTHLCQEGAVKMAGLVADAVKKLDAAEIYGRVLA